MSAGPQVPTRPIDKQTCPDSNHVAAPCPAATNQSNAAGQDEGEEISAIGIPNSDSSSSNNEQPGLRPGRPRLDPDISPRGRTRLRVQRHRDQQHLARVQQIVHQAAVTQELPPTVEFSALTLRDDDSTPSSSLPAQIQSWSGPELEFEAVSLPLSSTASPVYVEGSHGDDTESSSPDANAVLLPTASAPSSSLGLPRQDDGQSSSRPRSSTSSISDSPDCFIPSASPSLGPENHHPILGGFLQAIHDQDTAGGPDFLRAQGDLYDRVLRTFFSRQCECKSSSYHHHPTRPS